MGCPYRPGPDDGGRDGGTDGGETCLAFDQVRSATVIPTGTRHPVALASVVRSETQFCVDEHAFGLRRLDASGLGAVGFDDAGMWIRADRGGVYVLVDEAAPTQAISRPHYFARAATAPLVAWPRYCEEVHRLTSAVWACDGVLFDNTTALPDDGTRRWMRRPDGVPLAVRSDGITEVTPAQLGTDAGTLLFSVTGIEAWAVDDAGVSVATDAGFLECLWGQTGCSSLGPRFGTGDVPLAQQRLISLMRRDGHTLFSVAPAASPFCEARLDVQKCSMAILGGIVAARGNSAWAGSTLFGSDRAVAVAELRWDGGWSEGSGGFVGPPEYFLKAGVRAQTPSRVIYGHDRQFLFWQWDAPGEAFELVEIPDAGPGPLNAGASPGFFWVSVGGPAARTQVFAEE